MVVMAREKWTDERLDDLNVRVDRGFEEVKGEIRETKGEVRELRKEMNTRFGAIDARLDSNQRTMILGFASIVASVIGGVIATQL